MYNIDVPWRHRYTHQHGELELLYSVGDIEPVEFVVQ